MWERYLVASTAVISWGRGSFPWIMNGRREWKAAHSFDAPPCTAAGLGVYKSNPLCTSWIAGPQVLDLEPCWALLCLDAAFISTSCGDLPALKDGMMFVCHVLNGCLLIHCLISLMSFVTGVDLFSSQVYFFSAVLLLHTQQLRARWHSHLKQQKVKEEFRGCMTGHGA